MKALMPLVLLIGRFATSSAFTTTRSVVHISPFVRNSFTNSEMNKIKKLAKRASSPFTTSAAKRVLVPIADDSEEIETTCITDTLTRFGADVVVASVKPGGELVCKMSRGVKMVADIPIEEATGQEWDLVALPGGMPGAEYLRDSAPLIAILEKQKAEGKLYGAICASPAVVLADKGLIGDGATCFPAPKLRKKMASPVDDDVVVQGNVVTSKGPATAIHFGLKLGELLYGKDKAKAIATEMLA